MSSQSDRGKERDGGVGGNSWDSGVLSVCSFPGGKVVTARSRQITIRRFLPDRQRWDLWVISTSHSYLAGRHSASCQKVAPCYLAMWMSQRSLVKSLLLASSKGTRCITLAANISCYLKLPLWEVKQRVEWHCVTKPFLGGTEKSFYRQLLLLGCFKTHKALRIEPEVTNDKWQLWTCW